MDIIIPKKTIQTALDEISLEIKENKLDPNIINKLLINTETLISKEKERWFKDKKIEDYQKKYEELRELYRNEIERSVIIIETDGNEHQRHKSELEKQNTNRSSQNEKVEISTNADLKNKTNYKDATIFTTTTDNTNDPTSNTDNSNRTSPKNTCERSMENVHNNDTSKEQNTGQYINTDNDLNIITESKWYTKKDKIKKFFLIFIILLSISGMITTLLILL